MDREPQHARDAKEWMYSTGGFTGEPPLKLPEPMRTRDMLAAALTDWRTLGVGALLGAGLAAFVVAVESTWLMQPALGVGHALHNPAAWRFTLLMTCLGAAFSVAWGLAGARHRGALALLAREKRFNDALIAHMPGLFFVFDDQYRLVRFNQLGLGELGRRRCEALRLGDGLGPRQRKRVLEMAAELYRRPGRRDLELVIPYPGLGRMPMLVSASSMLVDGRMHLVGVAIDLSERKHTQQNLAILAAALEQADEDVYVLDTNATIMYVNAAVSRSLGYSKHEMLGQPMRMLRAASQPPQYYESLWAKMIADGFWKGRLVSQAKDGREVVEENNIAPIKDEGGRLVGYVIVRRDITEQLVQGEKAASAQRLEALGTLAGGIAHDFNNILAVISGYLDLALEEPVPAEARGHLGTARQAARRGADLTRQVLSFSSQQAQDPRPLRLTPLVEEATRFLRAALPNRINIRTALKGDPVVFADPGEINRIILNLGVNAGHAMAGRNGDLAMELDQRLVEPGAEAKALGVAPGMYASLRVTDTGVGMPPEVRSRIFEPFFTTRARGQGTGMGLAVVHGIVKACRGAVTVDSLVGQGTSFCVLLPLVGASPIEESAPGHPQVGRGRVLFVDDEPEQARLALAYLGRLGYQVTDLTGSQDALLVLQGNPQGFDLLITDMSMPGMSGLALAARARLVRDDLPIILCTGGQDAIPRTMADVLGLDAIIEKPFAWDSLSREIHQAMQRRAARSAAQ